MSEAFRCDRCGEFASYPNHHPYPIKCTTINDFEVSNREPYMKVCLSLELDNRGCFDLCRKCQLELAYEILLAAGGIPQKEVTE